MVGIKLINNQNFNKTMNRIIIKSIRKMIIYDECNINSDKRIKIPTEKFLK